MMDSDLLHSTPHIFHTQPMATPSPLLSSDSSLTGSTSSPSSTGTPGWDANPGSSSIPPVSLCLILSLFLVIFGALVARSVRQRRQRNITAFAALTSGAPQALKPALWEARVVPVDGGAKGWDGICPVAGAMLVPVEKTPARGVRLQHPASWRSRLRFPLLGRRPQTAPDLPPADPLPESPASSSESVHLTVLISMPTPLHGKARQDNEGPPVVELGIAQVTYTSSTTL
ncbi:hypothetical protein BC826DRAFT_1001249 [Russula brevipes]|nr:hypothetical protein BC826DRAFT_1001249 [Russula brevipes]